MRITLDFLDDTTLADMLYIGLEHYKKMSILNPKEAIKDVDTLFCNFLHGDQGINMQYVNIVSPLSQEDKEKYFQYVKEIYELKKDVLSAISTKKDRNDFLELEKYLLDLFAVNGLVLEYEQDYLDYVREWRTY